MKKYKNNYNCFCNVYTSSWNVRYPMYMALWFCKILTLLPKATLGQSEAHLVRSAESSSVMNTGVTFLHSNLLKVNREPGFRQMHYCEFLSSHVTVYQSYFLYIDLCCLYVANLKCFSTGCNKLYIYREHIWWCWQNGCLFTISTNGNPCSIPFVPLNFSVIFHPWSNLKTAYGFSVVLHLSSFSQYIQPSHELYTFNF
jgi:hypothetical protein